MSMHAFLTTVLFVLFQIPQATIARTAVFAFPNPEETRWYSGVDTLPISIDYFASMADFINPERGFMQFTETRSGNYDPLDAAQLMAWRSAHAPGGDPAAAYFIFAALIYRGFYLENFTNGPISNAYLNAIQQDFDAAREAGVKLVVRFAYTQNDTPPYGDAPKSRVLQHIAQLKPLLQANADVIAVLQMGFIGAWGEGYYTDHFGVEALTAQNWTDRTEVLAALLDALPPERGVAVRYPQMKQKAVYGPGALPDVMPLTLAEAWQDTRKARIGFVNDCFLSGDTDTGTYINYDLGAPSGCDTCIFKPYMAADSRYVAVGGETCADWNPYSDCTSQAGGNAQHEMARMHFSYLNSGWYNEVNNDWVTGNCIEEIKKRLGYRLELQHGEFSSEAAPGQTISLRLELKNTGFAAPFNPRKVRLILRNTATGDIWQADLPDDPRTWFAGDELHIIEHTLCLPSDLPVGDYDLLLHLADPAPTLTNRPEYAIRLANQNLWEAATGFNKLLYSITVGEQATSPICTGEMCFQSAQATAPTADFMADIQSGCAPLTVTFSSPNAACLTHQWEFPGGTPSASAEANPTVVYQTPGAFAVSLTVNNATGSDVEVRNGFIEAVATPVVSILPPTDIQICAGQASNLAVSGVGLVAFQWYKNGLPIAGATTTFLTVTTTGMYKVFAANAVGCGAFSTEITVDVVPAIAISIAGLDTSYTNQDPPVTMIGNPPGGTFSGAGVSGNQFSPELAGVGEHTISYMLTDANGCTYRASMLVTVSPSTSTVLPDGFAGIRIFPNPSRQDFSVKMNLTETRHLHIRLMDVNGRVLETRDAAFPAGESVVFFDNRKLPAGMYVLEISSGSGRPFTGRVVVTK